MHGLPDRYAGRISDFADAAAPFWNAVYATTTLVFIAALVHNHFMLITTPVPLDLYEGTMAYITGIFADGKNPFRADFQPAATVLYPTLYNMLVAPLTHVFGNSLPLHRAVAAVGIWLSCAMVYRAVLRSGHSKTHALAAFALLYAALLFYTSPVGSPNGIGLALFLAGLLIPWHAGFSNRSLAASIALGLLAFYTKQYFGLGMALVAAYLFLFVSKLRAAIFALAFFAAVAISLTLVHLTSPHFIDNTVLSLGNLVNAIDHTHSSIEQAIFFSRIYGAVFVLAICCLLTAPRPQAAEPADSAEPAVDVWNLRKPLLNRRGDFWWCCFICSALVVGPILGRNPGNYMTYHFQLLSPLLLMAAFISIARCRSWARILMPLIFISFHQAYAPLPQDFRVDLAEWDEAHELIETHDTILASSVLVMAMVEHDKKVYHGGHTSLFPFAFGRIAPIWGPIRNPKAKEVWGNYERTLGEMIENKRFDLLLAIPGEFDAILVAGAHTPTRSGRPRSGKSFYGRYYAKTDTLKLSLTERRGGGTLNVEVWRPR